MLRNINPVGALNHLQVLSGMHHSSRLLLTAVYALSFG